jgi:prepilin-type N-terminal cleavage/methylation domain-containing protein
MKIRMSCAWRTSRKPASISGFSFTEILVALAILCVVTAAMMACQLFGMRMFNVTATKLGASQGARIALGRVRDEIRSGKTLYVGNGRNGGFTNVAPGQAHEGNALRIYPTAATNNYVTYFLDATEQKLKRQASGSTQEVIASYITNQLAFRAEDYAGNAMTNDVNNRVIKMSLDFYQWEFPVAQAGLGAFYDYYHLQTRISRRTIE